MTEPQNEQAQGEQAGDPATEPGRVNGTDGAPAEQQAETKSAIDTITAAIDKATTKVPDAQPGDEKVEVAKPVAKPKLQSLEEGRKELDANPARASTLTSSGHLVRE